VCHLIYIRPGDAQVNEFVKRVRAFRIHLLIIGHIKQAMPALFGKDKAAKKMLAQLPDIFRQVGRLLGMFSHTLCTLSCLL
jgi:EH domain-containing protein 1